MEELEEVMVEIGVNSLQSLESDEQQGNARSGFSDINRSDPEFQTHFNKKQNICIKDPPTSRFVVRGISPSSPPGTTDV